MPLKQKLSKIVFKWLASATFFKSFNYSRHLFYKTHKSCTPSKGKRWNEGETCYELNPIFLSCRLKILFCWLSTGTWISHLVQWDYYWTEWKRISEWELPVGEYIPSEVVSSSDLLLYHSLYIEKDWNHCLKKISEFCKNLLAAKPF